MKPNKEKVKSHCGHTRPTIAWGLEYLSECVYYKSDETLTQDANLSNLWKQGEWIWEGLIPKKMCNFDRPYYMQIEIDEYFNQEKWKRDLTHYDDENWDSSDKQDYYMENFLKSVWLTNEYVTNNGFENALCTHWNPRANSISIHPGGVRNRIASLYGPEMLEAIFFNTGNVWFDFMEDMEPVDLEDFFHNEDANRRWGCSGVPDHGSFIPHCGKDMHIIPGKKREWYQRIYNRITENRLKVYVNQESSRINTWCEPWLTTEDEANAKVYFDSPPNSFNDIQAVYAIFAEVNFESQKTKIVSTL